MKQAQRLTRIMEILSAKDNASTKYLCKILGASESTIRRDIEFLASLRKEVRKVHGGVVLEGERQHEHEYMFELKQNVNVEQKRRIAEVAAGLIDDGDSIVLDSGTTCLQIAVALQPKKHLRIATVDLQIALELARHEHAESLMVGGLIRPGFYSIGESMAVQMLDNFVIDKAIMAADAIDIDAGVTNFSIFEVSVKRKMLEIAEERILVADHTKFGTSTFYRVAAISRFTKIITSSELDPKKADQIREKGTELILA